jgi:3-oxoacyl-[acyl-carrier protein] reductase
MNFLTSDLTDQVALVTGATGELGRVIARTLAERGADIAVHYHSNAAKAAELADEITALGRRSFAVPGDVSDRESVAAMKGAIEDALSTPSIVVLNAVSKYNWKPVLEQPLDDFEDQFRSCVAQTVLVTQAFVPAMVARGSGRIIGISSEAALQCYTLHSAYAAGKRGTDGVLRCLAREVGPHGVTVNQIAPGWVVTDKDRRAGEEHHSGYESAVPLRRRGEDIDIAAAVAFLASEQARFITGAFLPVCGGNVMVGI